MLLVFEKMFESRLFFVDKLIGMGARIVLCDPHRAVISRAVAAARRRRSRAPTSAPGWRCCSPRSPPRATRHDPQHRADRARLRADRRAAARARRRDRAARGWALIRGRPPRRRRPGRWPPRRCRRSRPAMPPCRGSSWREWAARFGLVAGITTRLGGFDLGLWSEAAVGQVMTRWRAFHAGVRAAVPDASYWATRCTAAPCSGTESRRRGGWCCDGVDGHATAQAGRPPHRHRRRLHPGLSRGSRDRGGIALLHAGWRGVAGAILERGVETLAGHSGRVWRSVVMHCGVGICGNCYEVGSEVAEQLRRTSRGSRARARRPAAHAGRAGRANLGIREVTISTWCTAHDQRPVLLASRLCAAATAAWSAYLGPYPFA